MKSLFLIVLIGFTMSCGQTYTFKTPKYGVKVFVSPALVGTDRDIDPDEVDIAIDHSIQQASRVSRGGWFAKNLTDIIKDWTGIINFNADPIDCTAGPNGEFHLCAGIYSIPMNEIFIHAKACMAQSAIHHEIFHMLQWEIEDFQDTHHTDRDLFISADSAESRAMSAHYRQSCSKELTD